MHATTGIARSGMGIEKPLELLREGPKCEVAENAAKFLQGVETRTVL